MTAGIDLVITARSVTYRPEQLVCYLYGLLADALHMIDIIGVSDIARFPRQEAQQWRNAHAERMV